MGFWLLNVNSDLTIPDEECGLLDLPEPQNDSAFIGILVS
jgi:hypothetical protein